LYDSLKKHCNSFHLYVFAFDESSYNVLKKLCLDNATIISLTQFEDKELLNVKNSRTSAEYCWTSTSSTILYVLENFDVDNCTYIDADIYFYAVPKAIFNEMGDNSILITEHRYSRQYSYELPISGRYCVQFVTFKNDERALKALRWWRARCLEWCYNRNEDGKFGDQLYLDDWTERFEGVHILQNLGGGLAPWNIQQYSFTKDDNKFLGTELITGKEFDVIFYHFQFLKFYTNGQIELGDRLINKSILNLFYKPYLKLLKELKSEIIKIDKSFDPDGTSKKSIKLNAPLIYVKRKIKGTHNIYYPEEIMDQ
jgi:hypothetical protein